MTTLTPARIAEIAALGEVAEIWAPLHTLALQRRLAIRDLLTERERLTSTIEALKNAIKAGGPPR